MNLDEVRELIRKQSTEHLAETNSHSMNLQQALVTPQEIWVIARTVKNSRTTDNPLRVWLVGQEHIPDGYRIIMNSDGSKFGLASSGLPQDKYLVLVGWYGDLRSALANM